MTSFVIVGCCHSNEVDKTRLSILHSLVFPKKLDFKLPMRYGFPFRAFHGVSLLTFKRGMMERFGIDEKEFNLMMNEEWAIAAHKSAIKKLRKEKSILMMNGELADDERTQS